MQVSGSIAIVSGAADGIGRAFVQALTASGARVLAFDIDAKVMSLESPDVLATLTDIRSRHDVEAAVALCMHRFGRIDMLINNAAHWMRTPVTSSWTTALEDWDAIMEVNLKGLLMLSRSVIPHMRAQQAGNILNLSTYYVLPAHSRGTNPPDTDLYNASKWALNGFTDAWAKGLKKDNICVNGLCMGATDTAMLRGLFADGKLPPSLPVMTAQAIADFGIEIIENGRSGENVGAWAGEPLVLPSPGPDHERITGTIR